jgi:hypothetical protein
MADFFESSGAVSETAVEEARAMRRCIGHLDRLIADDFFDYDYFDEKYGKDWLDMYATELPEFNSEVKKAYEDEENARQNALSSFLQIFKDRVFNWWD